jgi:hypothetical protein
MAVGLRRLLRDPVWESDLPPAHEFSVPQGLALPRLRLNYQELGYR